MATSIPASSATTAICSTMQSAFLQRWSVDAVADAELVLDDLSGFSGLEAMAQARDDRLWVVDEAQGQWELSLRGVTDTSATWSAELDPPGPFDIFYSGFRVAADDEALYLRTPSLDAMLQRWSGDGELLWAIAWDGERDPMPFFTGLAVAPGGDAITLGRFAGAPWLRRHDRDGVMRWSSTVDVGPQTGRDYPYDVVVDPDGGIVVAGEARIVDPPGDSWQVWLAGYSADGEELWQRRYVPEDPDGGFTHVCALARGTIADAPIYLAALGPDGLSVTALDRDREASAPQ